MTYLLVKHRVGFGPLLNSMAKVMLFCFLPLHLKKIVISCWVSFSGRLKTSPHTCEESIKDKLIIKCECQQINYIHTYTFFYLIHFLFSFAENKNMKNDFKNWEIMFYVDTVEENQLPFDGCTVEENTSSKPPAPRFSQSKNLFFPHWCRSFF